MFRETRRRFYDEDSWENDRTLDLAFPPATLTPEHPLAPYLGYEQNDAMVLGCAVKRDAFTLTIDHYNVWRLASVARRTWSGPRDCFPVELRFAGVREMRVVLQAGTGEYRLLRSSIAALASVLDDVIGLKCVGANPGSLLFHLRLNSRRMVPMASGGWWAGEIDVLLECESASVAENLRQNWIDAVGEESLPLLDALLRLGPFQSWGVPDFERFVAEKTSAPRTVRAP